MLIHSSFDIRLVGVAQERLIIRPGKPFKNFAERGYDKDGENAQIEESILTTNVQAKIRQ